ITYRDANGLAIGTVNGIGGVASGNNSISVSTAHGALTGNDTLSANDVDAGTSTVALTAGGDNSLLSINTGAKVNGITGLTLAAGRVDFARTVASTGTASLHETTTGRGITLGTDDNNAAT